MVVRSVCRQCLGHGTYHWYMVVRSICRQCLGHGTYHSYMVVRSICRQCLGGGTYHSYMVVRSICRQCLGGGTYHWYMVVRSICRQCLGHGTYHWYMVVRSICRQCLGHGTHHWYMVVRSICRQCLGHGTSRVVAETIHFLLPVISPWILNLFTFYYFIAVGEQGMDAVLLASKCNSIQTMYCTLHDLKHWSGLDCNWRAVTLVAMQPILFSSGMAVAPTPDGMDFHIAVVKCTRIPNASLWGR